MSDGQMNLVGTLGRDPEMRFTQGGVALCSFTMAVSHRFKSGDDWKEETAWVDVTCWRDLAENVAACCTKGTRVVVLGRLRQEEWDDKETGKKRTKLTVVADEVATSLRWATVEVHKTERTGGRSKGYDDADPFA